MPELPEMEAWRRQLNDPVSAFPIERAGPAHIATLKTFDPPLQTLEGSRLRAADHPANPLLSPPKDANPACSDTLIPPAPLSILRPAAPGPKPPPFRSES